MRIILSLPFCLITTVLACLLTSPVSDFNVVSRSHQKWRKFTPTCEPGSQGLYLPYINPQMQWHEISVFEKKMYDVINKVCTFMYEILTILTVSHCRQWKREPNSTFFNLIWRLNEPGDLSLFIAHFELTHENALLCKILNNSMLVSFTYS